MKRVILLSTVAFFMAGACFGLEENVVRVTGLKAGMKRRDLVENWGYPAKRERRGSLEIWFYLNDKTPRPTDGVAIYLKKNKIERWAVSDNIYSKMGIWGKGFKVGD